MKTKKEKLLMLMKRYRVFLLLLVLNTVLLFIERHYADPITNAQLADLICLSEDRFCHLFREEIGSAPLQYINEMRLKKAMALLERNEYTVTEVAEAVGFRDYNHFITVFGKAVGMSPRKYRLAHQPAR